MEKNYNTKMASLKATVADIRKLNAKQLDAEKIKLQGKDIKEVWGFQDPEDFKKLCKRVNMDELENEYYELLNDEGEIMYFNIPNDEMGLDFSNRLGIKRLIIKQDIKYGIYLQGCKNIEYLEIYTSSPEIDWRDDDPFGTGCPYLINNVSKLKTFKGDISKSTNSNFWHFFLGCPDLEEFSAKLPTFVSGDLDYMFITCNLNSDSIKHILNSISDGSGTIGITMNETAVNEFNNITGNTEEIPLCDKNYMDSLDFEGILSISYKNWTIFPSINVYSSENIMEEIYS